MDKNFVRGDKDFTEPIYALYKGGHARKDLTQVSLLFLVLLVATFTTSLQPKPDAEAEMRHVALSVGCCCGIGKFQLQLL